jgi:hypothetical protein
MIRGRLWEFEGGWLLGYEEKERKKERKRERKKDRKNLTQRAQRARRRWVADGARVLAA